MKRDKYDIIARIETTHGNYDVTLGSKYLFEAAMKALNAASETQIVMIGECLAIRAGDFIIGTIIDEGGDGEGEEA